jgi:pyridoxal phosphate enzyme (YggS family)
MAEMKVASIRERYLHVLEQIEDATARSGRKTGSVHLITVTKSQPIETVRMAVEAGATLLGENYADEAVAKIHEFEGTAVVWHMIGHVQSRKAQLVAQYFDMLHSLDSARLAGRLDRFCDDIGRNIPALLEVNISGEESKYGLPAWDDHLWPLLDHEIEQILVFNHVHLVGLMTMPPFTDDPEQNRPYFQHMRQLQEYLFIHHPRVDWTELSMGTSVDYISAVEEGATFVRIGEAILGPRSIEVIYDN